MNIEEIREILNDSKTKYTKRLRTLISEEAARYGITAPNCACRNKWTDMLLQIYKIKKEEDRRTNPNPAQTQYKYLRRFPTFFMGKSYDGNSTARQINVLKTFNPQLFSKIYREL